MSFQVSKLPTANDKHESSHVPGSDEDTFHGFDNMDTEEEQMDNDTLSYVCEVPSPYSSIHPSEAEIVIAFLRQ